ncbi:MAG: sortase [Acidimicrobiia bacterium]|jgi:sortase A
MRYRVQVVGWTLIWSGVLVFGYLGWLIYGTDFVNAGVQKSATQDLNAALTEVIPEGETVDSDAFLGTSDRPVDVPDTVEFFEEEAPETGEPFSFLTIPDIGLEDVVVYEGVDTATLKNGPGHIGFTAVPGQPGNAVISGHRTTYGRPFFDLDLLGVGGRVVVETGVGTHIYEVRETIVVEPTDVWVTDPRPGGWLTLTTCNPRFSARERLVVFAEMVDGPNYDYIRLQEAKFSQS